MIKKYLILLSLSIFIWSCNQSSKLETKKHSHYLSVDEIVKIPIDKRRVSETSFTGSGEYETTRTLVSDDINPKSRVNIDIECDGWWITETSAGKSVGYTFILRNIILD